MKHFYKGPVAFLAFAIIGLLSLNSAAQNKQFGSISVENRTASLTVISIDNKGPIREFKERGLGDLSLYYVSLRNDYDKPIAVYKLEGLDETSGEPTNQSPEGTFLTKWTFKPGQTMTTSLVASTGGKIRLIAEAVIFESGDGDGDPAIIASLQEQRKGASVAYQKLIPTVKEALKNPDSLTPPVLIGELGKKIDNIWPDKCESDSVRRGFDIAKGYIGLFVRRIEHSMNSGESPNVPELLTDQVSEMETGLKRFSETTPVKTASHKRNK